MRRGRSGGVIDLMIGVPAPTAERRDVPLPARQLARPREPGGLRVPGAVHVQGRAPLRGAPGRPGRLPARREMDKYGIEQAMLGTSLHERRSSPAAMQGAPRPLLRRASRSTRTAGMDGGPRARSGGRGARREGGDRVPGGLTPAGADQRQEVLPDLREVRRARHPDLRVRGRARAAGAVRAAVRRPDRRGVLVLPRAEVRHPPRLRAVGRPRGEAAAQVAEPLLLDLRVRAEVLPEGRRPLREHARRRQGDVRGLLPDGPRRSTASSSEMPDVPFRDHVWPKFLRENAVRVFKLGRM